MKIVPIFLLMLMTVTQISGQISHEKKLLNKDKQFESSYDKFKDQTQLTSPRFTVNKLDGKTKLGTGVMLFVTYPGQKASDNADYLLVFLNTASDWKWTKVKDAIALVDGTRVDLTVSGRSGDVESSRSGWGRYSRSRVYVEEEIHVKIDRKSLDRILAGNKVEIQIGGIEFALHDVSLTIFKKMLGSIS